MRPTSLHSARRQFATIELSRRMRANAKRASLAVEIFDLGYWLKLLSTGFHLGLVVLTASLKSRRTCSSRFRAWLSS
jgi:hypothetical protein